MSSQTVDIGSKSGKFKYILVQQGQKYLLRGDPNLDYHGIKVLAGIFVLLIRLSC
jgi:hypothetical protein